MTDISTPSAQPPNPGSDAAIKKGCTCPVLDNGHGSEELGKMRGFWMTQGCPLHAISAAQCTDCQNILPFHTCGNCEADFQTEDNDQLACHLCKSCFNQDMFLHKI